MQADNTDQAGPAPFEFLSTECQPLHADGVHWAEVWREGQRVLVSLAAPGSAPE